MARDSLQADRAALRTDRIADPWGARTPYGPGREWPVRVDAFLEEGTSEEDVEHWAQSASILHSNGDAMDVAVPATPRGLGVLEGDLVRVESLRGALEGRARISGIRPGMVFVPFHYGYWDRGDGVGPSGAPRAANELTITAWDPVSKQPAFKVAAVRVRRLAAGDGPAPAPTTGGAAPVDPDA
ncbi:MAG: hypothetical protein QOD86_619, partial [Miltoncostaeaceae bacterium]|nr:hypothetical protein [Miltoncostaeaceae bacterium]